MLRRNCRTQRLDRFGGRHLCKARCAQAIATSAFRPAEAQPVGDQPALAFKNAEQHLFMIAGEIFGSNADRAIGTQALDNRRRPGPAIDQVAEEDDRRFPHRMLGEIAFDLAQQIVQQIVSSMDIADRIDADPREWPRRCQVAGAFCQNDSMALIAPPGAGSTSARYASATSF